MASYAQINIKINYDLHEKQKKKKRRRALLLASSKAAEVALHCKLKFIKLLLNFFCSIGHKKEMGLF